MIYDDLTNIDKYNIDKNIINSIKNITENTSCGRVDIDGENFINIDEYSTKPLSQCRFEAHKKYIDIQIMLDGKEKLDFTNVNSLSVSENYDSEKDVMFFENPCDNVNSLILSSGKFVILYPYEAHRPQMISDNAPLKVKKAVVKIKIK